MRRLAGAAAALVVFGAQAQAQPRSVVAEARTFMAAYARDIVRGDRSAISLRYDPDGAFLLNAGTRAFALHQRIVQDYAEGWNAPYRFE